jgi:hypothetical protein
VIPAEFSLLGLDDLIVGVGVVVDVKKVDPRDGILDREATESRPEPAVVLLFERLGADAVDVGGRRQEVETTRKRWKTAHDEGGIRRRRRKQRNSMNSFRVNCGTEVNAFPIPSVLFSCLLLGITGNCGGPNLDQPIFSFTSKNIFLCVLRNLRGN